VVDAVPGDLGRLYPVGRLDRDSEGLILVGNNGPLTDALLHPRHHVPRTYHLLVRPVPTPEDLARLETGVRLSDGFCRAHQARRLAERSAPAGQAWIQLVLHDGRNREARRLCAAIGSDVLALIRMQFGSVALGSLAPGEYRRLSDQEIRNLWRDARS
jgi:23S rRNA pseudouridine2605 synthase